MTHPKGLVLAMLYPKYEDIFTHSEYELIGEQETDDVKSCWETYYSILSDIPYWMLITGR